jgi:hypothetical protein
MRYEKKVSLLAGSLAILLLIWAVGLVFSPDRRSARAESASLLTGKPDAAAAIELSGTEKLSFVKEGAAWFLTEADKRYPAQGERIANFLDSIASVKRLGKIAGSKDAWASFGLEEEKAKRVLVKDKNSKTLADFSIGGYGPTGKEVYLRRASSDATYSVESGPNSYLSYGRKSWLDLSIFASGTKESDVQSMALRASIALDGKGKPGLALDYRLTRDKTGWTGPSGALDTLAVDGLVRSILALEGEDYLVAPASAFSPVAARIELGLGNGQSRVVEVGSPLPVADSAAAPAAASSAAAPPDRYYLRLAGSPYVQAVSAYSLRNILKPLAELASKK